MEPASTRPLRLLICDDEALALQRLRLMAGSLPAVEILGEALTGEEALREASALSPDVLLLDVEMPGLDGFDVVERLPLPAADGAAPPLVVFVTAHARFAVQAFETGALDFLGKPVRLSRLVLTLERARAAIQAREAGRRLVELQTALDGLRDAHAGGELQAPHVWVNRRGETVRIDLAKVDLVRADAEYVRLYLGSASYLHRAAIGALEQALDPRRFVRVHRSAIVRWAAVASVRRVAGRRVLVLTNGEEVQVGRKYARDVQQALVSTGHADGA